MTNIRCDEQVATFLAGSWYVVQAAGRNFSNNFCHSSPRCSSNNKFNIPAELQFEFEPITQTVS